MACVQVNAGGSRKPLRKHDNEPPGLGVCTGMSAQAPSAQSSGIRVFVIAADLHPALFNPFTIQVIYGAECNSIYLFVNIYINNGLLTLKNG
jgi:hypothetical protein